ncbi:RrF2 family transcriptional regulator [Pendulispora albinea]|uniref:Rrf2 family transcriptional regulator n=1 Tax=Pendulispora albinea TaxID=2741071 RepID=A0ABZ2M9Q9_9BACT
MILRNQVEWALHCMGILASLPEGKYLSAHVLSEFHRVPKEYLSKALQELAKAGLIEGRLGPKGGYRLARTPDRITVLDVVEAVQGSEGSFHCTEIRRNLPGLSPSDTFTPVCVIADVMYRADHAWREALRQTTIADIGARVENEVSPNLLRKTRAWLLKQID